MPGFFPHTNLQTSAYTPLAKSSADAVLTDIVNDVGAGINGWTLWDDQRSNLTDVYYVPTGMGQPDHTYYQSSYYQYYYWTFTQNNSTASAYLNSAAAYADWYRTLRTFGCSGSIGNGNLTGSQISLDGTNWYTVVNLYAGSSYTTDFPKIYLDRNFAQATTNVLAIRSKIQGYIVLKCTSAQKTFYVKLTRPSSYADGLMVRTFESWDNVAHSGSVGGPTEVLRTHNSNIGVKSTDPIRYVLWLLPDVFGLWMGGDPLTVNGPSKLSDFIYIGNLTPYRAGDTDCLVQICTNTEYSGVTAYSGASVVHGGAIMLRGLSLQTWQDPTLTAPAVSMHQTTNYIIPRYTGGCWYAVWPKGMTWMTNPWRAAFDNYGRFQITEIELYSAEQNGNGSGNPLGNEAKRGDLKYVKFPVFNPSGFHLIQFGPADDGNTYICIKVDYPYGFSTSYQGSPQYKIVGPYGANTGGGSGQGVNSGWAHGNKVYAVGDVSDGGGSMIYVPNFFMMPTNL